MRIPAGYDNPLGKFEDDLPGGEHALAVWNAGPGRRIIVHLGAGESPWPWLSQLHGHSGCQMAIGDRKATITSGWDFRGYADPSNVRKYIITGTWDARPGIPLGIRALTPDPHEQDVLLAMLQSVRIKPDTNPVLSAEESLWHWAARGHHYHDGTPDSIRSRLVEPSATRFFIELVQGKVSVPRAGRSPALYWVAEAADPAALPVLLEHSRMREQADFERVHLAQYGLARLAPEIPAARRRLEQIAVDGSPIERYSLVGALLMVNDATAQSILRFVRVDDLREATQIRRTRALDAPPWPPGQGRMFCREHEERRMSPGGLSRCMPRE